MKIFKVKIKIDTGYEWLYRICILYANSEEEAKEKAERYVNKNLRGERFADAEKVTKIDVKEDSIIYQNCF